MAFLFGEVGASGIPMYYFQLVYVVGFIAAVVIGSLAWYNSKRPPGWEDAARPDFIPDVEAKDVESQESDQA
ncbi:hypothetical protein D0962_07270 [Leptolyngbyaceae cyanobacterium CCMR0082]|uniref:Uncharacterized protein n=2 Tax=Adonisia turfae TaxID=2950184 RepID=A0A6M0S292_9CYAN|nr:hypothetical protein [Adonisia turfae]MDV3347707.1 hypothetical protein [Leptothoe sp. LEGE 181152]NEZ57879.1 hypothetical protein [Adonisia turfae CCMR0081]NEZ62585.1 hypothetical protein [Adonisia turfae CCMR0082]